MPRLGGDPGSNRDAGTRRNAAMAYNPRSRFPISNVLLLLFFTFILRNMFFHDYRKEEVNALKASGKSPEEISKMVGQAGATEKRVTMQERKAEYENLKSDVQMLKEEVERLKAKLDQESEEEELVEESFHEPPEEEEEEEEEEVVELEQIDEEEAEEDPEAEEQVEEAVLEPPKVVPRKTLRKTAKKTTAAQVPVKKTKTVREAPPAAVGTTKKVAPKTTKRKTILKKRKVPAGGLEAPVET